MWHFWSCFHHRENPQQTQHTHSLSVLHWDTHSESFMRLRPRGYPLRNAKIMGLLSRFVESLKALSNILSTPWSIDNVYICIPYQVCTFDGLARTQGPPTLKSSCFNVYFNSCKLITLENPFGLLAITTIDPHCYCPVSALQVSIHRNPIICFGRWVDFS